MDTPLTSVPSSSSSSNARVPTPASAARAAGPLERTLRDVVRDPLRLPDVVVLDRTYDEPERKEALDPKQDLWLSTADGRFASPIIPVTVGQPPTTETFFVHKNILQKSAVFKAALSRGFQESESQAITLPDDDPGIFHFIVAYLYEGKYTPIKPLSTVLIPDEKGKGKELENANMSDPDDSADTLGSDVSAVSRQRRERRRRRDSRRSERLREVAREKRPGAHRPNCDCPQCLSASGPPCWSCQAPRAVPPPPPMMYNEAYVARGMGYPDLLHGRHPQPRHPPPPPRNNGGVAVPLFQGTATDTNPAARISGEDLRTWLLAYELNLDVYIMATKYLLDGLKTEVARNTIDMLETAGFDAAVPEVFFLCRKLYDSLPKKDELLKMIFARVSFLQPCLKEADEVDTFLDDDPRLAAMLLRAAMARRAEGITGMKLPSMEVPTATSAADHFRAQHYPPPYRVPGRW